MSKAKAKMTSKIISDYQSKIAEYIKKNEDISNEILDLKNSIDINDSILSQMMSETNLRSSIEKCIDKIDEKYKANIEKSKIEQSYSNAPMEIALLKGEIEKLKGQIEEKGKMISKVERHLIKERKNALFKDAREEVFVVAPTKDNIAQFNKITFNYGSTINSSNDEKKQIQVLTFAIKSLEGIVEKMKEKNEKENEDSGKLIKCYSTKEKSNNMQLTITNNDIDLKDQSEDDCDNNSNSFEDDEISIASDDKDEDHSIEAQVEKAKKELERLTVQNQKYKQRINKYKETYVKLKEEIQCLTKVIKKSSMSTQDTSKSHK